MGYRRYGIWLVFLAVPMMCLCGQDDPVFPPDPGNLVVRSEPFGASVEIDGSPVYADAGGTTPKVTPATLQLPPGRYRVSVSLGGHEAFPAEIEAQVKENTETSVAFCLRLTEPLVSRVVLVEHFGNVDCEPCGPAEIAIRDLQQAYGYDQLVTLGYRTDWPYLFDALYQENPDDHGERILYYYVINAPTVFFDGSFAMLTPTQETLEAAIQLAFANPPHFSVEVRDTLSGTDYRVAASVTPVDCPLDNDVLIHFALVEREAQVSSPNTEEETVYNVVRDLMPDASGEAFTPAYGETLTFWRSRSLDSGWDTDEIETVVFVQSLSSKEILQAASTFNTTPARR